MYNHVILKVIMITIMIIIITVKVSFLVRDRDLSYRDRTFNHDRTVP
jgi:hypothetical protein